ncbi:MAG: two-component sensor histidine kinase [Nocardiopsaceae bacterium]|nr:two-component sensor histidine kinase [Nocardiopsaceae bacterium]
MAGLWRARTPSRAWRIPARLWRRCDVTIRDLPLALLLAGGSLLPAIRGLGTELGGLPTRHSGALAVAVVALECLPLAVRRRWPAACLTLVSLGFALDQLLGYHEVAGTALPIALLSGGVYLERQRRATAIGFSVGYVLLAVGLHRLGGTESVDGFVTFYLALALAWGTGAWVRSARATEAERRRSEAEAARVTERTRIARELHDIVTHHVTAMVVQAEAARYLVAAPDRLDETLNAVTDTGRQAITDLRHLLDVLNPDHNTDVRMPSAAELHALVEQTRRTGQPVEFAEEGKPAESVRSAEFVAYRVVQEALTNALKYAHGARTVVRVRYGEREIVVGVSTDGSGSRNGSPGGSGRGLAGLRARVDTLGGEFIAGQEADGGFIVQARIPAGSAT